MQRPRARRDGDRARRRPRRAVLPARARAVRGRASTGRSTARSRGSSAAARSCASASRGAGDARGLPAGPPHSRRLVGAQRAGHDPAQRRGRRDPDGRPADACASSGSRRRAGASISYRGRGPSRNLGRSAVMRMPIGPAPRPRAARAAVRRRAPPSARPSPPAEPTTGPCDAGAPCTLQEAVAGAAADDTVRVASGTYDLTTHARRDRRRHRDRGRVRRARRRCCSGAGRRTASAVTLLGRRPDAARPARRRAR